jgi:hypothetical protein
MVGLGGTVGTPVLLQVPVQQNALLPLGLDNSWHSGQKLVLLPRKFVLMPWNEIALLQLHDPLL